MDDRLKKMWDRQKEFNRLFFDDINATTQQRQARTKEMVLCLISESDEVLRSINWKIHRRNVTEIREDKLTEEIIDAFKYVLCLAQAWHIDEDEFFNCFNRKSDVVEQRYKQELQLRLLTDENVVAIDIDGVIFDYPYDFIKYVEEKTKIDLSNFVLKDYNLYEALSEQVGKELLRSLKHEFRITGQKQKMTLIKQVKEGLDYLKSKGKTIVLLSARPTDAYPRIFGDTIACLKSHGLIYDAIIFDENKEDRVIKEFPNMKFLIEDSADNANKVAMKGYKVYLINKTYNEDSFTHRNVIRINGWEDILKDVK